MPANAPVPSNASLPTDSTVAGRAIGAFVGAAAGDALGAPFEFRPPGTFRRTFPEPVLTAPGEMTGGGPWLPGEFTDDTQMAVALGESLCQRGGLDSNDVWARWRSWAIDAQDVGVLTRRALEEPGPAGAAQIAHDDSGGMSAGNGTIMRNVPVALFTLREPLAAAADLAVRQAALTHHDRVTHEGAVLHTVMVRAAVRGDDPLAALAASLATADLVDDPRWRVLLGPSWHPDDAEHGNGTVWTCLAQAVWAVRHADSFERAVVDAVDLGDDADTVACVAGAIAGARFGIQGIPSRWTMHLNGRIGTADGPAHLDTAGLQDLARRLIGRGTNRERSTSRAGSARSVAE